MIPRYFIPLLLLLGLPVVYTACETTHGKDTRTFMVTRPDSTIKPIKINIAYLAKNYKQYQGQYIETSGRFFAALEEFAIYTDKNVVTGDRKGFWLDTDPKLEMADSLFGQMDGNHVRIIGRIDTADKGHMSAYPATIKKIYFWEGELKNHK